MRERLIDNLRNLSDRQYQERCWVKRELPEGVDDDGFDYVVHFFFDDTDLSRDAHGAIGRYLKDENEARAVQVLVRALDRVIEDVGRDCTDGDYIASSHWVDIVGAASDALRITTSSAP